MQEIWTILEQAESGLHEQSSELLAEVAEVVQRQQEPTLHCAVLLLPPEATPPASNWFVEAGVQRIYLLQDPAFAHYATSTTTSALAWLLKRSQPTHPLLIATHATPNGRDWSPRLAAQLQLPFVPACLALDLRDDMLLALRPLYDGRAYAQTQTALAGQTALATFLPGKRGAPAHKPEATPQDATIETIRLKPELVGEQRRVRRLALQAPSPEEVELDAAERIVAGGRGIGQAGFTTIADFAQSVGAAVGATRVATDFGWIEHARQIGATGKIVRPKLYIACGISGAPQHTSGMSDSQTVVAINPDRNAPIFALADLGLLGDANQVLPLATKLLEEGN